MTCGLSLCLPAVVCRYKKLEQSMEEEGLTDEQVITLYITVYCDQRFAYSSNVY